ncbi:MAG: hypothetical protein JO112_06590, partial [Planctomycetes bacterium]|nr:hypothetical protein [Planctomycetota bacterium]
EASRSRFQTRPELFTALFFTGLLIFLVTWRAARRRSPWMVPLLFVVWANFHAAVALGIVILGVTAACDLLQDRWSRRSWTLALVWLLSVAAVFVNPIGLSYWQALVPVGGSKFADIVEWTSPWNLPQFPTTLVIEQAVLLGLALAAWLANPGRRWAHLAWLLVLAGAFAEAVRFTWLLALTSLAVLAANAQASVLERFWEQVSRWRRGDEGARPVFPPLGLRRLVRWSLLTWLILGIFVRYSDLVPIHLGLPATLRQGGVCFLRRHPPAGHLLNDYENSSYLQWSFAGQPPLFIDLLNAYPDQVQVDYQDMVAATPRGRELLDQYPVDEIFLTVNRPGPSLAPLGDYLDRSPGWARAYAGFDGVIWVRRTPDQEPLWRHPELRTSKTFGQLELIGRLHD